MGAEAVIYTDAAGVLAPEVYGALKFIDDFVKSSNPAPQYRGIAGDHTSSLGSDDVQHWFSDQPTIAPSFIAIASDAYNSQYALWLRPDLDVYPVVYLEAHGQATTCISRDIFEFLSLLCLGSDEIGVDIEVDAQRKLEQALEDADGNPEALAEALAEGGLHHDGVTRAFRAACLERYGISAPDDFGQAIKARAAQESPDLEAWIHDHSGASPPC